MVRFFGGGPGLYFDLAKFSFHVPTNGSAAQREEVVTSSPTTTYSAPMASLRGMAFIADSFFLIVREWACRKPDGFENALNQLRADRRRLQGMLTSYKMRLESRGMISREFSIRQ
jgi:hypothetical protein